VTAIALGIEHHHRQLSVDGLDGRTATQTYNRRLDAERRRAAATLNFAELEEARTRSIAKNQSASPRDLDLAEQQLALAHAEPCRGDRE
jgi:hypothetical protein